MMEKHGERTHWNRLGKGKYWELMNVIVHIDNFLNAFYTIGVIKVKSKWDKENIIKICKAWLLSVDIFVSFGILYLLKVASPVEKHEQEWEALE